MTEVAISTAKALRLFRDELEAEGFPPEQVADLVRVACDAEVRATGGLTLNEGPSGAPEPGVLADYGRPYPTGYTPQAGAPASDEGELTDG